MNVLISKEKKLPQTGFEPGTLSITDESANQYTMESEYNLVQLLKGSICFGGLDIWPTYPCPPIWAHCVLSLGHSQEKVVFLGTEMALNQELIFFWGTMNKYLLL